MTKADKPTAAAANRLTNYFKPLPARLPRSPEPDVVTPPQSHGDHSSANAAPDQSTPPSKPSNMPAPSQQHENSLSFGSSISGSQGSIRVIPSSDGEDSSEDSDDLEDPSKLLRSIRVPSKPAPQKKKKKETSPPRSKLRGKRSGTMPPPPKGYKFSLANLVAQRARANALNKEMAEAQLLIDAANDNKPKENADIDELIAEGALDDAFGKGNANRLMAALTRKDAWRVDKSWHFFVSDEELAKSVKKKRKFPDHALPVDDGWLAALKDVLIRRQFFLSGFVTDMIKMGELLPDDVLHWILDQLCLESRQDLSYAYSKALQALSAEKLKQIVTPSTIIRMFELLGGIPEACDLRKLVTLVPSSRRDDKSRDFWNVKTVVQFLGGIAHAELDSITFQTACGLLLRLALDIRISNESEILGAIEDSIEALFTTVPQGEWEEASTPIAKNIMETVLEPSYRLRAINVLPIHPPCAHLFRRRLALAVLFEEPSYLINSYNDLVKLNRFSRLLQKPQFEINHDTEYEDLQALISIMDIAIDDGATSGTDKDNDKEVEDLVDDLRRVFTKIQDTNAQNLARTETKDGIERLNFRLRFGVKTKDVVRLIMDADDDGKAQTKLSWPITTSTTNTAVTEKDSRSATPEMADVSIHSR